MNIIVVWLPPLICAVMAWGFLEFIKSQFGVGASIIASVIIFFGAGVTLLLRNRSRKGQPAK